MNQFSSKLEMRLEKALEATMQIYKV